MIEPGCEMLELLELPVGTDASHYVDCPNAGIGNK
jgi:hypothetical protein